MYSYRYMQMCIKFSVIQQSIEPINYGDMDYDEEIENDHATFLVQTVTLQNTIFSTM